jgi:oligopeptide transport system substrate-binding protein
MKKLLVLLLSLVVAFSLVGCEKDTASGTLNWNIGADPKTLDPSLNGASDGGDVINQTFEGLVREINGEVLPGMAESWEVSADGKTVTFNIRKDAKWSNGDDLTAHDFVYGWLHGIDPASASEYSWLWHYTNVVGADEAVDGASLADVGIKAVDDYTFEVQLTQPTDYFVSLTAFYHFMPLHQESVEAAGGEEGLWAKVPELAVSNGPFHLTAYTAGEGLTLEKNQNYWNKDVVKIAIIEGKFIDDASTAFAAFNSGELDFIPSVPSAEIPRLIAEDSRFHIFPLLGTYYYSFNLDNPVWEDAKVRRALALSIDREAIVEALGTGQTPAAGFVPPGFKDNEGNDFFETAGTYGMVSDDSQFELAQELLAEAGYPGGAGFPTDQVLLYNTSEGHKLVAEMVQQMWKENLGIEVELANQEWAVFQTTRKEGNFDIARGGWLTDYMDPSGMLAIFTSTNAYNDPNFYNDEFDQLMADAMATTDKAEHFAKLYEAQELFMTEMPIVPVYHYSDSMLVSESLVGWSRSVLGSIDFSRAEIK